MVDDAPMNTVTAASLGFEAMDFTTAAALGSRARGTGTPVKRPHRHPYASLAALLIAVLMSADAGSGCRGLRTAGSAGRQASSSQLRQEGDVPAMGLSIFCAGEPVLTGGYGERRHVDTPFRWGSITKSLTGLAALQLVRTTKLTLDSPVRPILGPGWYQNPWAPDDPRANLPPACALRRPPGSDASGVERQRSLAPSGRRLRRHQDKRVMLWPPGLQHSYSNVPPGLTAAVVERVSEQTFESFLEQQVFQPLGMQGASLSPVRGLPGGYQADGRTEIPYWHMTFTAFGALNASTRDMNRLLSALLNEGQLEGRQAPGPGSGCEVLSNRWARWRIRPGWQVGYGAGVYGWVRSGQLFHGHGGDADGYRSRYGLLRAHGRGYLLVINTDNPQPAPAHASRSRRML